MEALPNPSVFIGRACQLQYREFKNELRRLLNDNVTFKYDCVSLSVLRLFFVGHVLYQISEMYFRLLGTNRFHVKAKTKDLLLQGAFSSGPQVR